MSEKTKISWCDSTVNFWEGCTEISDGCAHCYAKDRNKRWHSSTKKLGFNIKPTAPNWGKGAPRRKCLGAVKNAFAFNRNPWVCDECGKAQEIKEIDPYEHVGCFCGGDTHRRRIFSLSLGDWLDDEVPIEWLAEMLDTIRQCDQVRWILCSKRWENFKERLTRVMIHFENTPETSPRTSTWKWVLDWVVGDKIPSNIIGLCSVENQKAADERIPQFLTVPLACRGLSMEPLLGPVNLVSTSTQRGAHFKTITGTDWLNDGKISWLIIGGESGPNARPCNVDWIRSIMQQGRVAGVTTFVKQLGAKPEGGKWPQCEREMGNFGRCDWSTMSDKKGGDPSEWPRDLQVQQWPKGF